MATPPDAVREELAVITTTATAELQAAADQSLDDMLGALDLIVPEFYDAAGALAVAWYDEIRDESNPTSTYTPAIIGDPATDWIEREVEKFQRSLADDLDDQLQRMLDETLRLAEKEVARGYRDSILGNVRQDEDAVGWSRVARPGACKMCRMLADKGAIFHEATALFAAHTDCHCAARPHFRNGEVGPEATVEQYLASRKRRTEKDKARLRAYLIENYPDAPG